MVVLVVVWWLLVVLVIVWWLFWWLLGSLGVVWWLLGWEVGGYFGGSFDKLYIGCFGGWLVAVWWYFHGCFGGIFVVVSWQFGGSLVTAWCLMLALSLGLS